MHQSSLYTEKIKKLNIMIFKKIKRCLNIMYFVFFYLMKES